MRKAMFLSLLCVLLVLPSIAQAAKAKDVIEFSFQSMLPDNHVGNIYFLEWAAMLEEKSGGRLKMNLFTNASITRFDKVITGVQGGAVDIGMASVSFNQTTFPYAQVSGLPFIGRDSTHATKVLWEVWRQTPEFQAEFKNNDLEVLTMWCVDRSVLFATKSLVKKPSDLKGKRVLIGSGAQADEINKWGGSSIVIPMSDSYVGLQRGMGEVIYSQITAVAPYKLYEVAKYLTMVPAALNPLYIIVNKDFMNSLPPDLQVLLRDTMGEKMGMELGALYKASGDADTEMMAGKGITIYTPSDEEMEEFKKLSMEATIPMWKKIFTEGGIPDPDAWIEKAYKIADGIE